MSIIEFIIDEHKEWVSTLTNKNIANILNTVAGIPNMKTTHIEPKSDIASVKGKIGEDKFESIVTQFMSIDYELINVAKQGKAGDFMIKWRSQKTNKLYKLIIDVKNYNKSTVPSLEVEKFHRDLTLNNVNGGILLSLHSRITGTSKIIELKEILTDKGLIPILLVQSDTPIVIVEVIKLLFHIIEIKDLNNNDVYKSRELIYHINQLGDSIQTITDCRDILQLSKIDIEKSLNNIMLKLMTCELGLVSKINRINSSLIIPSHNCIVLDNLTIDTLQPDAATHTHNSMELIKNIRESFSFITPDMENYIYDIYNLGWDTPSIELQKKELTLIKQLENNNKLQFIIKFARTGLSVLMPKELATEKTNSYFNDLISLNKIKKINSKETFTIKIDVQSINYIKNIYKSLVE